MCRELVSLYLEWADSYYRKPDGRQTREAQNMEHALRHLIAVVADQSLDHLETSDVENVREHMIDQGICRSSVNVRMAKCRRFIKWCICEDLASKESLLPWLAVQSLKYGRSRAPERDRIRSVPPDVVQKTIEKLPSIIAKMVAVQYITGMRSGELCYMQWYQIDRSIDPWIYSPNDHKTAHHGHDRHIPLDNYVQSLIGIDYDNYVFLNSRMKPYTPTLYRYHIKQAAIKASVPHWFPHQLRHSAATRWAHISSTDDARNLLVHASIATTLMYLDRTPLQVLASKKKIDKHLTN